MRLTSPYLLAGTALPLLLIAGCSRSTPPVPPPDPDVVARVGPRVIRSQEVRDWMRRRAVPDEPAAKQAVLAEIIEHHALVQQALDAGLDQEPEFRRSWENQLIGRLREARLEPQWTNVMPGTAQIQAYYQSNQTRFAEPAMRQGAILFMEVSSKASEAEKTRTRQRMAEARVKALSLPTNNTAVRGFGALAVEYSEDQITRYRGGDLGWIVEGRLDARVDPLVVTNLFALPGPGTLSDVLETPRGLYLVRLLDERPTRVKPFASVQAMIQHQLLLTNRQQLEHSWKTGAVARYRVETFPEALQRIRPASPPPAADTRPPALP